MLIRLEVRVARWVLVREMKQVVVVQRMGLEPRPGLGESRADPPPPEPDNPIQATAANGAGLPEGAAIARRQHLRREATAPIDSIQPGKYAGRRAGASPR